MKEWQKWLIGVGSTLGVTVVMTFSAWSASTLVGLSESAAAAKVEANSLRNDITSRVGTIEARLNRMPGEGYQQYVDERFRGVESQLIMANRKLDALSDKLDRIMERRKTD